MKSLIRSYQAPWGWFLCFLSLACTGWIPSEILAIGSGALQAADPYRLQLLDGKSLEGTIVSISSQKVQMATLSGTQEFPAEQIKSLKHLHSSDNTPRPLPLALELRDGTNLHATSAEIDGKSAMVKLGTVEHKIPAAEIRWIRFRETVAANEATWQEILATESKSDRLIIVRAGDSLDTITGLVAGMDANEVRFNFDGEDIKAPRNKLLGMTLFSTSKKSYAPAKIKVTTLSQDSFAAVSVESIREANGDLLKIVTAGDIAFQVPWEQIDQLDFSAGNLQMLAELSPIQAVALISADFPGDIELAKKLFAPHAGHYGRESTTNDIPETDIVFQGSGVAEYRVPDGMNRFQTNIAGSPSAQLRGWTVITVQQEDTVLFQQSFSPESNRLTIDVPVVSKRRLILKVQPENPRQVDDTIWWLQPRFVK